MAIELTGDDLWLFWSLGQITSGQMEGSHTKAGWTFGEDAAQRPRPVCNYFKRSRESHFSHPPAGIRCDQHEERHGNRVPPPRNRSSKVCLWSFRYLGVPRHFIVSIHFPPLLECGRRASNFLGSWHQPLTATRHSSQFRERLTADQYFRPILTPGLTFYNPRVGGEHT